MSEFAAAILGSSEVAVFENLYVAYAAEARGVARAILGDSELSADAVHNGFVEMLRHVLRGGRWHDPAEARAMVLRNVRWAALDINRRRRRTRRREDAVTAENAWLGDAAAWARHEARAVCVDVVSRLPERDRRVLHARYIADLSDRQAASALGLSLPAYKARLRRALVAARNAARARGAMEAGAVLGWCSRATGVLHRPRRLAAAASAAGAAAAGALVAALAGGIGAAMQGHAGSAPAAVRAPAAIHVASLSVTPEEARILAVVTRDASRVLVLADVPACRCDVVFSSGDQGRSWQVASGPLSAAQVTSLRAQSLPLRRCTAPVRGAVDCGGRAIDGLDVAADPPAYAVTLARGRELVLPVTGGMLCTDDDGRHWASRCP